MNELVNEHGALADLLAREGRSLAISLPQEALVATREFQAVMQGLGLEGQIFVAHKATDRTSLVHQLVRETGVGVDVASLGELEACLARGSKPEAIIVTGPKSTALLARAVEVGVRAIVIDSLGELERLIALQADAYPDVLLRLTRSVLNRPGVTWQSRFGLDKKAYEAALALLERTPHITLRGLAFHLDTRSIDEKVYAASVALDMLSELPARGFRQADVLDIGGGFGCSYDLTAEDINAFDNELKQQLREQSLATYQTMSYGLKKQSDGRITGNLMGVDIPVFPVGAERLHALFKTVTNGHTLAERANEMLVEVWCEPGRAVFTPAGAVASEVIDVSERDGYVAIVTNIQHGQVLFDGLEVLIDPIHLPAKKTEGGQVGGYLFGHLCMERDILSHRLVQFAQAPRPGDILLWPHTGGYRMHMSQTRAIMHPEMARYRYQNKQFMKDEQ